MIPYIEYYAVYGTLKKGLSNHKVLENCELLSTELTKPEFKMLDIGYFPGVVKGNKSILIEIYEVENEDTKRNLDRLEGFNRDYPTRGLYNKIQIETSVGKTWLYTWNGRQDFEEIESGNY